MNILSKLRKPWFIHNPFLIAKALFFELGLVYKGWVKVKTCFGVMINCDTSKVIGKVLYKNGVYELPTSELMWRLLKQEPDSLFVDVGANIGYYSLLARQRQGNLGEVISFEPVPDIYEKLLGNLEGLGVKTYQYAVSNESGSAQINIPKGSDSNDGISTLQHCVNAIDSFKVQTVSLDKFLDKSIFILKIDIEGHEFSALSGASSLLANGKIRHIVFEEHDVEHSSVVALLANNGYSIYSIGWDLNGLILKPLGEKNKLYVLDAPNFIASRDIAGVINAISPGWTILQRK